MKHVDECFVENIVFLIFLSNLIIPIELYRVIFFIYLSRFTFCV